MLRALLILVVAAASMAQSEAYTLGPDGEWVLTESPEEGGDRAFMAEMRRLIDDGTPGQAKVRLNEWIREHKKTNNPYLPTAYLLRGDARAAAGNEYRALYDYEKVIRDFPSAPEFVTAVERELAIAISYVHGLRKRAFGVRIAGAEKTGEQLLILVDERMPGSQLAETANIQLADYYFRSGNLEAADTVYELFIRFNLSSRHRKHALLRRVQASIGQFKGPKYDATMLTDAELLIRDFKQEYPLDAERENMDGLLARIEESKAAQQLDKARWYMKRKDSPSAQFMLKRLVRDHPTTIAGRNALDILNERGWLNEPEQPVDEVELIIDEETP